MEGLYQREGFMPIFAEGLAFQGCRDREKNILERKRWYEPNQDQCICLEQKLRAPVKKGTSDAVTRTALLGAEILWKQLWIFIVKKSIRNKGKTQWVFRIYLVVITILILQVEDAKWTEIQWNCRHRDQEGTTKLGKPPLIFPVSLVGSTQRKRSQQDESHRSLVWSI